MFSSFLEDHGISKVAIDAVSVLTVAGTIVQFLPPVAALFTIIWTGINIYEWWKKD